MKKETVEFEMLCKAYLEELYQGLSGYIHYESGEKEKNQQNKIFLTYGEILYPSVLSLLRKMHITENDIFCDLGSGVGKMAIQVFLETKVKEAFGVEASTARHGSSMQAANKLRTDFPIFFEDGRELHFYCANFLEADISRSTIIYSCSTCFSETLLAEMTTMINRCPNLKYVISLKKIECKLPLKETIEIECSWDKTNCYFYSAI